MKKLSYNERAILTKNNIGKKLFQLMEIKKTNLALSADATDSEQLIALAEQCGPDICIFKTHIDIISDFSHSLIKKLKLLAKQYEFLIFEDRKFSDIGNTARSQYQGGIYQIAKWADLINAHAFPGPGIVQALDASGLLLVANLSSRDCLADANYVKKTIMMAEQFPEKVLGFITGRKISNDPTHIHLTPGIQFHQTKDALDQQYITPEMAFIENQTDIIIVGRGILKAENIPFETKRYKKSGWESYLVSLAN